MSNHSGTGQQWVAPKAGIYSFECWGASGGKDISQKKLGTAPYGNGGYTRGNLSLTTLRNFYVFVGGIGGDGVLSGSRTTAGGTGGWNGGGAGSYDASDDDADGGGGGATDIRITYGAWNDLTSLKSRIMVAGGGGGSGGTNWQGSTAGCGGNTTGGYATYGSGKTQVSYSPGTQTNGYRFGEGQTHTRSYSNIESGGGGGGYYGGCVNTGSSSKDWGGCGGSSFISGYSGCNAIKESCTVNTGGESNHTGSPNHYSGFIFTESTMISGATSGMPNPNETSLTTNTITGNSGNGYCRITYIPD